MILETNPDLFPIEKAHAKRLLRDELNGITRKFLRKMFDKPMNNDYEAQAVIEVAKEFKIDTSEMEVDYALELSRKDLA